VTAVISSGASAPTPGAAGTSTSDVAISPSLCSILFLFIDLSPSDRPSAHDTNSRTNRILEMRNENIFLFDGFFSFIFSAESAEHKKKLALSHLIFIANSN
jgi:hypothetical protein